MKVTVFSSRYPYEVKDIKYKKNEVIRGVQIKKDTANKVWKRKIIF